MTNILVQDGKHVKYFCPMETERGQNQIGRWIQLQLDRREWRAADLSRRIGVPNGNISRWVNGRRVPDPASCDLLADVFGADVDYVLMLAGHRPPDFDDGVDPERAGLIASLRRVELTPDRAATLRALFEQWARRPVPDWPPEGRPRPQA